MSQMLLKIAYKREGQHIIIYICIYRCLWVYVSTFILKNKIFSKNSSTTLFFTSASQKNIWYRLIHIKRLKKNIIFHIVIISNTDSSKQTLFYFYLYLLIHEYLFEGGWFIYIFRQIQTIAVACLFTNFVFHFSVSFKRLRIRGILL